MARGGKYFRGTRKIFTRRPLEFMVGSLLQSQLIKEKNKSRKVE